MEDGCSFENRFDPCKGPFMVGRRGTPLFECALMSGAVFAA
jgi:hypothetical protein